MSLINTFIYTKFILTFQIDRELFVDLWEELRSSEEESFTM